MVKRIKKRVPKSNVDTQSELEGARGAAGLASPDGTDSGTAPTQSERLLAEINANANNASADRFSEMAEGFFLGLAEHWIILVMLGLVGVGVYGFIQYNDQQHRASLATERAALQGELKEYQKLQDLNQVAWSALAAPDQPQLPGLSVEPEATDIDAPKPEAFSEVASKFGALKSTGLSAPLATLAQASALFDAAQSSEDFVKAAELFTKAAQQSDQIELIAQGIALRNAALSYEEAARTAGNQADLWTKAIGAWETFGEANEIYTLTAQVNQARALRLSNDLAGARKLYQEIKRNHAQLSSKPNLNEQVKIGLALTAELNTAKTEPAKETPAKARPAEKAPAKAEPAEEAPAKAEPAEETPTKEASAQPEPTKAAPTPK